MSLLARMNTAMERAGFTLSDMAVWYEGDRSTLRKWLVEGHEPRPIREEYLEARTALLEKALRHKKTKDMFPIPFSVNQFKRKGYIEGVREHATKEFFGTDPAE